MAKKVVFLGMGGTIAGRSVDRSDNVGYQSAQVGVAELLAGIPGLGDALGGIQPESAQVAQVDSKNMSWPQWLDLSASALHHLQREDVGALVITHGTDTLEETAFFLSLVLPRHLLTDKPVVLTCAMRPSTADFSDGPANLCDAATVATSADARGVLVVCAGSVHAARDVQKIHPYRLDAFSSGEVGAAGFVEEGRVRWSRALVREQSEVNPRLALPSPPWPRVEIVMNTAGAGGALIRALCVVPPWPDAKVEGIVVAGTGNGTINHDMGAALAVARAQGIRVVVTTRCVSGHLVGVRGVPVADPAYLGLSPVKARVALVLELLLSR